MSTTLILLAVTGLVVGGVLGTARLLRGPALGRASELLGTDDPLVGLLLSVLALICTAWAGYELSLRLSAGADTQTMGAAALAVSISTLAGWLAGESLRAWEDGTATPLSRMFGHLFDPAVLLDMIPARGVSARHELRLACAAYLFDAVVSEPALRNAVDAFTPVAERGRTPRALRRLLRHTLAFDDLRLHGLRARAPGDARELVIELARMARALRCTDPATLADLRLIGGAMGLDAATLRVILRTHAGVSGEWTHRTWSAGSQGPQGARGARSRSGFGQRSSGPGTPQGSRAAHYSTLGLAPGASASDIKRAWRRMAKRHHPDRFAGTEMSETERAAVARRMREVNAAYEALKS